MQSDTDGLLKAWGLLIAAAKVDPYLATQKTFTVRVLLLLAAVYIHAGD